MRLALAQINPTIGDIAGNARMIAARIREAAAAGAEVVVLPELCLSGYPPKDLLLQEGFIEACAAAAKAIGERETRGITVVFGVPMAAGSEEAKGGRICNSLVAYCGGKRVATYDKRLLPTYDVFDEDRYFVPGERPVVVDVPTAGSATGVRVGLSI